MNILIIGGNRFFGRRLAANLIARGDTITLLNRGTIDDGLGANVERLKVDREDSAALAKAIGERKFDAVVDQVCFTARDARAAIEIFKDKTPLYLFTSTISTYTGLNKPSPLHEKDFDPYSYKFEKDLTREENYGGAKRQAEAVFFAKSPFRVIAARFPIVCGTDDYTKRLLFHIEHVKNQKPMFAPAHEAKMSYISSEDAARSLEFLLDQKEFSGPVVCSSSDAVSLKILVSWIESSLGQRAVWAKTAAEGDPSPYGVTEDFYATPQVLQKLGLKMPKLQDWMPELIQEMIQEMASTQS